MSLLLLVLAAAAAETAAAGTAAAETAAEVAVGPWTEAGEEIVIDASEDLTQARHALETAIWAAGFERRRLRSDRTVYPRQRFWKSKLVLWDDGRLEVRTRKIAPMWLMPRIEKDEFGEVDAGSLTMNGLWASKRTVQAMEAPIYDAVGQPLSAWRDAVWARNFAERRLEVREDVIHAWYDGIAPDGRPLAQLDDRRSWLLEQWLQTADNDAGETVRADLELFIDDVVQRSEAPVSAAELLAINDRRTFDRALAPLGL